MTGSKTFYLVRHGIATHSKRGYGKRKLTAALLPEAVPVIERLAQALISVPNSANFSSEIIRCRETSAIITRITGKSFILDSRINEDYHETIGEIRTRVERFLSHIETLPEEHIIICTHGAIIAAIKNLLINKKFVSKQKYDYPNTGELLIYEGEKVRIINFN